MIKNEFKNIQGQISNLLRNNQVYEAISMIKTIVEKASSWQLTEEFERINTEFNFLLKYFSDGILDSEREKIYNQIIDRLYYLTDKSIDDILSREDYNIYYSTKRVLKKNKASITSLLARYKKALTEVEIYSELSDTNINAQKYSELLKSKEFLECELFKYVWTTFPLSPDDIDALNQLYDSDDYSTYLKSLILSALLLSLIQFYQESCLTLLIKVYNSSNDELAIKSFCNILLILFLHKDKVCNSATINPAIKALTENPKFSDDIKIILFLLIRSKNTEKITKKVEDELMPRLMKLYPKVIKKFKSHNASFDISDLERNPEWKEMFENDDMSKKIEELNKLQLDGSDVFIGTFSHLKTFPFFNEISNWFLPFHREHSLITESFEKNETGLIDFIFGAPFFCDSDKYSFVASMSSVSEIQRKMMFSQLGEQNTALQELKNSELHKTKSINRETIANLYLQNIYRFFRLHPRKNDFIDPFKINYDIEDINYLTHNIDLHSTLELIGEFYLKNGSYKESEKYFSVLQSSKNDCNPVILQKIGFCHQNLENYEKAIEFYHKYELLSEKNLWNIRHLATCYRALKKTDIALNYYYEAESISPENISICLNIGHCLLELEKYDEALKYYYKVYYLEPNTPRAWRPIAWCLFMQKNYAQSIVYYDKIIQEKPSSVDYLNYGHLHFVQGNINDAIVMYCKSINSRKSSLSELINNILSDKDALLHLGVKNSDLFILINALSINCEE